MRTLTLVGLLSLLLPACAARSAYRVPPTPMENLTAAITGVSLDATADGACVMTVAIKGAGTGAVEAPRAWCADARRAKAILATLPQPAPKAPAATVSEAPAAKAPEAK